MDTIIIAKIMEILAPQISKGLIKFGQVAEQAVIDWKTGRCIRTQRAVNNQSVNVGTQNISGSAVTSASDYIQPRHEEDRIHITGQFIGEESFVDFAQTRSDGTNNSVFLLVIDQETNDSAFGEANFEGYDISLPPGQYSFYAFIIDLENDEVLGFGYPYSDDMNDPNPLTLQDTGTEMNFLIKSIDELEDQAA